MSANVELVRSICAEWESGDFSRSDWADPEIQYVWADGPSRGRWMGKAGMAEGFRDFATAWREFRFGAEDYRELDEERVLVLARFTGRGKISGLELGEIRTKGAHLFYLRDGKVTRYVIYLDLTNALTDLGLEE
jgi:hypothetical protein